MCLRKVGAPLRAELRIIPTPAAGQVLLRVRSCGVCRTDLHVVQICVIARLIGYHHSRMAGEAQRLGIFGFGVAAHFVAQVARAKGQEVYAFTRPGDTRTQRS